MRRPNQAGVTLIEMMAVVTIIGLIAAISFPAVSSGLESIRLASATDSVAAFLNGGLDRAERRQQAVEITVSAPENSVTMQSSEPGFIRTELTAGARMPIPVPGPEVVARAIADAIERPRPTVIVPWWYTPLVLLLHVTPQPLVEFVLRRIRRR